MAQPLISICIPAYKQPAFIHRLLASIQSQSFKDYEVIVTDDTADDSIEAVCHLFAEQLPLLYVKNDPSLGSPVNWNAAVSKSTGQWIKIMHGDDWFTSPESLSHFANAALKNKSNFIFSAYYNCHISTGQQQRVGFSSWEQYLLRKSPLYLLKRNYIGPPSTTMLHRSIWQPYEPALKWIVDFEGYIRFLTESNGNFHYINTPLISVGIHAEQVTTECFLVPEIEIPENTLLARRYQESIFQNFIVFDYFWRLIRNLNIHSLSEFQRYLPSDTVPDALVKIISEVQKVPSKRLSVGFFSKIYSFAAWLRYRSTLR